MATGDYEFIERFLATFPDHQQSKQTYKRLFSIDGMGIEITAQSRKLLMYMTEALAHLEVFQNQLSFDLRIELYSGSRPEFFDWVEHSFGRQVLRVQTDTYMCLYNPGAEESIPTVSFFDLAHGRAIFWIYDDEHIQWYEIATPFRTIFHWFFEHRGIALIHSASIGKNGKGILVVGRGGSGKTSTALTVFEQEELTYAGDDYVLVKMEPFPVVISLYCTAKVEFDTFDRLPQLGSLRHMTMKVIGDKEVLFPYAVHPEKIVKQLSIHSVLVPVIAYSKETTVQPLHSAQALLALAPSTIFQLQSEDTRSNSFEVLADLVKKIPCFELRLGIDATEIGEKVALLLQKL